MQRLGRKCGVSIIEPGGNLLLCVCWRRQIPQPPETFLEAVGCPQFRDGADPFIDDVSLVGRELRAWPVRLVGTSD